MRITRRQLRQIIKEAMVPPGSLGENFAVWTNWYEGVEMPGGTELDFTLYNKSGARDILRGLKKFDEYDVTSAINDNTIAVIRARVPDAGYGECNSAWEITRSAAESGYGPTLYDLVMSISPYGLTSDRSEVSQSARSVWSKYANNRGDVEKKLLDPDGRYTYNEDDDCTVDGSGSLWDRTPLPKLHRQMAIEFLEDYYPLEYEEFIEDQDPARIEDLTYVDGDEYWDEVRSWIESKAEDNSYDEWDPDEADEEWFAWKMEAEPDLADEVEGNIESPQQLSFSYNTDYAEAAMSDLTGNHLDLIMELEDMAGALSIDDEMLRVSVEDFFHEKYK